MSNVNVIPDFITWLYGQLAGNATIQAALRNPETGELKVYESQGTEGRSPTGYAPQWPEQPEFPLISFELQQCPHSLGNGGRRFASAPLVVIEVVNRTEDLLDMGPLATAIDVLFGARAVGVQGSIYISGSVGVEQFASTRTMDGGVYKYLGGSYEFFVFSS